MVLVTDKRNFYKINSRKLLITLLITSTTLDNSNDERTKRFRIWAIGILMFSPSAVLVREHHTVCVSARWLAQRGKVGQRHWSWRRASSPSCATLLPRARLSRETRVCSGIQGKICPAMSPPMPSSPGRRGTSWPSLPRPPSPSTTRSRCRSSASSTTISVSGARPYPGRDLVMFSVSSQCLVT